MNYIISSIFKALKIISANKMKFKYANLNGKQSIKNTNFVSLYNIYFCDNWCFKTLIKVFLETYIKISIFQQENG